MNRSRSQSRWQGLVSGSFAAPLLVVAFAAQAGCGGGPVDDGGAAGGGKAGVAREAGTGGGGMVAAERVANCAGFTAETAAEILGVPAAEVEDESTDLYDKLRNCSYASRQDSAKRVNFSLRRDDSIEEAADEMDVFRSHLGTAQGALAGVTGEEAKGAPYEEVPGLGDEALWAPINGTLNVRRGNVSIQVSLPDDREAQEKVAERVVAGLG